MAASCVLIPLMMILACTFLHSNNSVVGETHGRGEYSKKPKGTIKTIKRQDGDLVDCVDIYKQPSMDHPLLKNHTIQKPPSFPPNSLIQRRVNVPENERCPNGSVPIRRPFKDEATRAILPPSRHANRNVNELPGVVHKYAVRARTSSDSDLTALSALINVWKPTTDDFSFSLAQLWAAYAPSGPIAESVEAGWMVYPYKYLDQEPRFFLYYTNDGYKTGCYNSECAGFVQVDSTFCLGCRISPYSTYNGAQFEIDLAISQDAGSKDWWVRYQHVMLGYYPHRLFTGLSQGGASFVEWGGEVAEQPGSSRAVRTQMGSGHFAEEGFGKAAYFEEMTYEEAHKVHEPIDEELSTGVSHPQCYRLSPVFAREQGGSINSHFYFGGPGGDAPPCNV